MHPTSIARSLTYICIARYTPEARLVLSYANVVREKCITALANGLGDPRLMYLFEVHAVWDLPAVMASFQRDFPG
jgi:hypothetical protein